MLSRLSQINVGGRQRHAPDDTTDVVAPPPSLGVNSPPRVEPPPPQTQRESLQTLPRTYQRQLHCGTAQTRRRRLSA